MARPNSVAEVARKRAVLIYAFLADLDDASLTGLNIKSYGVLDRISNIFSQDISLSTVGCHVLPLMPSTIARPQFNGRYMRV